LYQSSAPRNDPIHQNEYDDEVEHDVKLDNVIGGILSPPRWRAVPGNLIEQTQANQFTDINTPSES
jgi:hypothetical protein